MGACANDGIREVAEEEPLAKFLPITKAEYDAYSDNHNSLTRDRDWLSSAYTLEEALKFIEEGKQ